MDPNVSGSQYPSEQETQRNIAIHIWKDRIYRFFYNIWPAVNRVITGIVYLIFKIIRGGVRIALEQFNRG